MICTSCGDVLSFVCVCLRPFTLTTVSELLICRTVFGLPRAAAVYTPPPAASVRSLCAFTFAVWTSRVRPLFASAVYACGWCACCTSASRRKPERLSIYGVFAGQIDHWRYVSNNPPPPPDPIPPALIRSFVADEAPTPPKARTIRLEAFPPFSPGASNAPGAGTGWLVPLSLVTSRSLTTLVLSVSLSRPSPPRVHSPLRLPLDG